MRKFIHFAQPLFGKEEKREIIKTLDSGWATLGPKTKQFEEEFAKYVNAKYAIAVSSCTAALHLSLIAAGIKEGDEVITTPFTFAATSNAILYVGAKPVFVDIDEKTFNIDVSKIEAKISPSTKAILPVHYGGQPVEMDDLLALAKKYHLKVIEDAAHAIGTEYKGRRIGSIGDLTCFSFHPIKNISTGDGGMITTNNKKYAEKLIPLRLHGMSKEAWKRHTSSGSWRYDIVELGYKYNMTDIEASLGIWQLRKLDNFIKNREEYALLYNNLFSSIPEITIPYVMPGVRHARNLYTILLNTSSLKITRDAFIEELKKLGIGASVYFIPLYRFSFYKKFGFRKEDFPVTERVFDRAISLPLYPKMRKSDIKYVAQVVKKLIYKYRK